MVLNETKAYRGIKENFEIFEAFENFSRRSTTTKHLFRKHAAGIKNSRSKSSK